MTSVETIFRSASDISKKGRVVYKITHDGLSRTVSSSVFLYAWEWDSQTSSVIKSDCCSERYYELQKASSRVQSDLRTMHRIIGRLMLESASFTVDDIIKILSIQGRQQSLSQFMMQRIKTLENQGKEGTAATYLATLNSFMRFRHHQDISLNCIDAFLVKSYETYLLKTGLTRNTTSFYMRVLRSVYNQAAEQGVIEQAKPFGGVYTGVAKTIKRAISVKEIRKIAFADLSNRTQLDFARDMFMFSFYTRGMSFIDIAYLTPGNLRNGYLVYKRHKTGRELRIRWEYCMQRLVSKYQSNCGNYLLPIIMEKDNSRRQYLNCLHRINIHLKELSSLLNIETALTMYVARHSWATIAKNNNIPLSVISEGMGHTSIQTTQIYLASLNDSIIDGANKKIINKVKPYG